MPVGKLFRYITPARAKLISTNDDYTVLRTVGVPFGGPEYLQGKDLHGEYFDKQKTDLGKDSKGEVVVKTIYAYYHHGLHEKIGNELIGYAKFVGETDEGQIWDLEIRRAWQYHDMLLLLAEKGLLGASSQPVQTSVKIDYESGLIQRWHTAEISVTPTPANPNAVVEIYKSFNAPVDEYTKGLEMEEDTQVQTTAETVTESEPTTQETTDISQEITEIFEDANAEQSVETTKTIKSFMETILAKLDAIETAQKTLEKAQADSVKSLNVELTTIKSGLKTFATHVAKAIKSDLGAEDMSEVERAAQREVDTNKRSTPAARKYIPANAPGRRN